MRKSKMVSKIRKLIQKRCGVGGQEWEAATREHRVPCTGCDKPVHPEYCYDWLLGIWLCDDCGVEFFDDLAKDALASKKMLEESKINLEKMLEESKRMRSKQ